MQNVEVPKLPEQDRLSYEGPLSAEERRLAITDMCDSRFPSVSGFNKEFIECFWS